MLLTSSKKEYSKISNILQHQGYAIVDGGLASELERKGYNLKDSLWSAKILLENPSAIKEVHLSYLKSGADIIITSSYQATIQALQQKGLSETKSIDLIKLSVTIACEAREEFLKSEDNKNRPYPLVAASIGSYGAYLANGAEYTGNYDIGKDDLKKFHRSRLSILSESGADLIAFETIPSIEEGIAIVELLKEFPKVFCWISFSCQNETLNCHNEPFEDCAKLANLSNQIVAIGVNCTNPKYISNLISVAKNVTSTPIIAYPNLGEEWDPVNKIWIPNTASVSFSDMAVEWVRGGGCKFIGGCCRTTPADIREIFDKLKQ